MKKILSLLGAVTLTASVSSTLVSCQKENYSIVVVEYEYWVYYTNNKKLPDGVQWKNINWISLNKNEVDKIELKATSLPSGSATMIKFFIKDGTVIDRGEKSQYWEGESFYYKDNILKDAFPNIEIKQVDRWED